MSQQSALDTWLATPTTTLPPWLAAQCQHARELVAAQGVPTHRDEAWRYTALRRLLAHEFRYAETATPPTAIDDCLINGLDSHRVVLINGRYVPALSDLGALPSGVEIASLSTVLSQQPERLAGLLTQIAGDGAHVFTALNTASMRDGLVLLLAPGVVLERPLELVHIAVGLDQPSVCHPRYLIQLGAGAQATLIERTIGRDETLYCTNAVLEIDLAPGAVLNHHRIQLESLQAFHLSGLYLRQAEHSQYTGVNIGLGSAWARTDLVAALQGQGANCTLGGLYLTGSEQLLDYHLDVQHQQPHGTSREQFKGILYGKGKAVFDGRVYVAAQAQKTAAEMTNRNLLLSPNAEIDTKPQLEIYADDVQCSHGTTVGQLEPEMLFYLRSRGIGEAVARRMLCVGFAEEIIDTLSPEPLRAMVAEAVGQRLELAQIED